MPDLTSLPIQAFLPVHPLHWTSIDHYLILLSALAILMLSGEDISMGFLIVLAVYALSAGMSLYINFFPIPQFLIFAVRTAVFALPLALVGFSPSEDTRSISIISAVFAFPVFLMTFINCILPHSFADPRILFWC